MNNVAYGLYLVLSIAMTIWVARVLSKNGEMFLVKCFGHDEELAKSTNHLLVIGFYLVNIGFIGMRLGSGWHMNPENLIPEVGSRVGLSVLVLGGMHFFNMIMIAKFGRTVSRWVHVQENHSERFPGTDGSPLSAKEMAVVAKAEEEITRKSFKAT